MNSEPLSSPPATHERPGSEGQAVQAPPQARLIQVIEDLPLVQKVLRDLLEETGEYRVCAISETESGAIEDFIKHQPAAVIVDLNLKQGSGLGFLQQVRRMHLHWRPVLIVVTNYAITALESACLKAGADRFLDKSRDLARLRSVIDDSLAEAEPGG